MDKELLKKLFNETYDEVREEDNDEEKFMQKISIYNNENGNLSLESAVAFAYLEAFRTSTEFMWRVLKRMVDSEELKQEMLKDIIEQAKEEYKRTGRNPFEM